MAGEKAMGVFVSLFSMPPVFTVTLGDYLNLSDMGFRLMLDAKLKMNMKTY